MAKENSKSGSFWKKLFFVALLTFVLYAKFPQSFQRVAHFIDELANFSNEADEKIVWKKLAPGLEIAETKTKSEVTHLTITVFMVRIEPVKFSVRVHLNRELSTAAEVVRNTGAIAAINASFFDPQGKPLGVLVQRSQLIQPMPRRGMSYSGVFFLRGSKPFIVHRSQFQNIKVDEAFQSMPRLISEYSLIPDIKDDQKVKRRSGIAIDSRDRIILAATDTQLSGLTLRDFQKFLSNPKLHVKSALNLDGGRSSQLFFRFGDFEKSISGLSEVPVFLCIFPN